MSECRYDVAAGSLLDLFMKRSAASLAASTHWAAKQRHIAKPDSDRLPSEPEVIVVSDEDEGNGGTTEHTTNHSIKATKEKATKEAQVDTTSKNRTEGDVPIGNKTTQTKELPQFSNDNSGSCSPLRLLTNPSIPNTDHYSNTDTFKLSLLIHAEDLQETFQFNFLVDLDLFLLLLHPSFVVNKRPITFITGNKLLDPLLPDTDVIRSQYNIREVVADTMRFGSHHTKMMVNFYTDNTVEVVVMTCNITTVDIASLSQMLWTSGRLPKGPGSRDLRFRQDLKQYLRSYKSPVLVALANRLDDFDFLSVEVELVASVPGIYSVHSASYGYVKLNEILRRNSLIVSDTSKHYSITSQVSSLAYPYRSAKGRMSSILTHLIFPLVFGSSELDPGADSCKQHQTEHNYSANIVYPTVKEVAGGFSGFSLGQALHFNYTKSPKHEHSYHQCIKPYLCRWAPSVSLKTGRERLPPHTKLLVCDNGDNYQSLRFVVMGSHNSSKQAWGAPKGPGKYEISSYELSILVKPPKNGALVPVYGSDRSSRTEAGIVPIRLPFALPPTRYSNSDKPWSMHVDHGGITDTFGRTYSL